MVVAPMRVSILLLSPLVLVLAAQEPLPEMPDELKALFEEKS